MLFLGLLLACDQPPAPVVLPPPLPPPAQPAALTAEVEVGFEERDQVVELARQAMQAQAVAAGLRRVDQVQVDLRCEGRRCTGQVTATGLP